LAHQHKAAGAKNKQGVKQWLVIRHYVLTERSDILTADDTLQIEHKEI